MTRLIQILGLWSRMVAHYVRGVARKLFNHPNVADPARSDRGLSGFLDGYSLGLDFFPVGQPWHRPKGADALWEDFYRVATDANSAAQRLIGTTGVDSKK